MVTLLEFFSVLTEADCPLCGASGGYAGMQEFDCINPDCENHKTDIPVKSVSAKITIPAGTLRMFVESMYSTANGLDKMIPTNPSQSWWSKISWDGIYNLMLDINGAATEADNSGAFKSKEFDRALMRVEVPLYHITNTGYEDKHRDAFIKAGLELKKFL